MTALPVRLSPTLPKDIHANGLLGSVARFVDRPDEPVLAVVSFGAVHLTTDVATGFRMPTIGIQEIELSCVSVATSTLRGLLDAARRERIGVRGLPFDTAAAEDLLRSDER